MSTLAILFESLAAARRAGMSFDSAWDAASVEALGASCDPADWTAVLSATRPSWEASYRGWPATPPERAVGLLGFDASLPDDPERTVAERSDNCRRCGSVIPVDRGRRGALFCSARCRRAFHSARARERVAA